MGTRNAPLGLDLEKLNHMERDLQGIRPRRSTQAYRDLVCGLVVLAATLFYARGLVLFTRDLQRPWLLVTAFGSSLLVALVYDCNSASLRFSLVRASRTGVVFAIGILVASWVRLWYVNVLGDLLQVGEVRAFLGDDFYAAVSNRVVGYGGAFAIGMVLVRSTLWRVVERVAMAAFVLPENAPKVCPHCLQPVREQAHGQQIK